MKKMIYVIALLALFISCQRPERPTLKKKEIQTPLVSDRQINPHGALFYAERMDDTYVENVGQVVTYRFVARKLPSDTSFLLSNQNLGQALNPIGWYEVDDDGQLGRQIDTGTLMLDNEMILMFDYCKGEPVEYWLISKDQKTRLGTMFVPYPIKCESRDGAIITIRRLTQDARLVLMEGIDFDPDERIVISSQYGSSRTPNVPILCTNGKFSMIFEAASPEKSGGIAYVDVIRKKERMMLEYDWGSEAVNGKRRQANSSRIRHDALLKLPTELN